MSVMIKLRLATEKSTLDEVRRLPGLKNLQLDERFGVVCIAPETYVVRAQNVDAVEQRRRLSKEIIEFYGDIKISTTDQEDEHV